MRVFLWITAAHLSALDKIMSELSGTKFIEWLGGAILAVIGWAVHRYNAIHRKMDRISEDVAVVESRLDHIDSTLEKFEKRWDNRRENDRNCAVKDKPNDY